MISKTTKSKRFVDLTMTKAAINNHLRPILIKITTNKSLPNLLYRTCRTRWHSWRLKDALKNSLQAQEI